ncbi:hypothetical protein [Draconibacterium mangrovi]|uniref:hypothetical protein n=1 Tax=Draconibacterium mangrovi TaxID=2697469 RepID=UPI0013D1B3D3|nr:hypothetical protein [Draconibacterium mangrovi]
MKHRIIIEYLYRDAANYKLYEEAEFSNPKNLSLKEFEKWFRSKLIDGLYFVPHEFGLTKPQFPFYNADLDHDWCEFILLKEEKKE